MQLATPPLALLSRRFVESKKLEDLFEGKFDYHPGSNNQVIDLVHPSLFPLQYGTPIKIGSEYAIAEYTEDIKMLKRVGVVYVSKLPMANGHNEA